MINALAKSGGNDAAFMAEQLLLKMLQNYKQGNLDSKPNTVSFTSVIDAFAKCSSVDGPRKAEAILRLMERTYLEGNKDAEPKTVSYSAVVEAWARSKERDGHERAQKIVDEMITLECLGRSIILFIYIIYIIFHKLCIYIRLFLFIIYHIPNWNMKASG